MKNLHFCVHDADNIADETILVS